MVFSQTSLKAQTVLKVVKLDHLKSEKSQQEIGLTEPLAAASSIDGYSSNATSSQPATTSFTEVSNTPKTVQLKLEPLYDSAMLRDSDFEFFQEPDLLYYAPEREEVVQTIDTSKKTEEKVFSIDTPHITFSPQASELIDVNSPQPQAGFYNTPKGSLSPNDNLEYWNFLNFSDDQNLETFLDFNSLATGLGDSTSKVASDMNSWHAAVPVEPTNTTNTNFNIIYTCDTAGFNTGDNSVDLGLGTVVPAEVEYIDLVPPDGMINNEENLGAMRDSVPFKRNEGLSVDVLARAPEWSEDISTPVILNEVMSLEKEKCSETLGPLKPWQMQNTPTNFTAFKMSPKQDYEPITPKSESHGAESEYEDSKSNVSKRRRHDSEDSDETYTPYSEQPPRKYKRRKPSVPIKDLILAIESQPKARRGRPPKRRESTVSSVCSVDDNSSSTSTHEHKYRELRDKNNVASRKSRMNRRVKEQQMEDLAVQLEESNKKLKVRVGVLEEMTKTLKNALMSAILKK